MCLAGSVRGTEFAHMRLVDVEDHGNMIFIKIPDKITPRSFTITNHPDGGFDFLALFRKYSCLRPNDAETLRFFVNYIGGKCTKAGVGIHAFEKIPTRIAEFLKLSDPASFKGHSLKATAVSLKLDFQKGLIGLKPSEEAIPSVSSKKDESDKNLEEDLSDDRYTTNTIKTNYERLLKFFFN